MNETRPMRQAYLHEESRIRHHRELQLWIEQRRLEPWIIEQMRRLDGVELTSSFLAAYAVRHHIPRGKSGEDAELLPWPYIRKQHRSNYLYLMLKAEANVRAGLRVGEPTLNRLAVWKQKLTSENVVVAYDPDSIDGWSYVERRPGIDYRYTRRPDPA